MHRTIKLITSTIILAILVAGCNFPFAGGDNGATAAQTAAAQTVEAMLTALPATVAPTNTPVAFPTLPTLPTATASPVPATSTVAATATSSVKCDSATYDPATIDVTYPDNTVVAAGSAFTKTWRLQNNGSCEWTTSYALVFESGDAMAGPAAQSLAGVVASGSTVDLSVNLTAPGTDGTYTGNWALRNAAGVIFARFYVKIKVGSGTSGVFAVTKVDYALSTWGDSCPRVTATIHVNGPGTVTFHWIRSDGSEGTTQTLNYSASGSQTANYDWMLGAGASGTDFGAWVYVDSPNHQEFDKPSAHFTDKCAH